MDQLIPKLCTAYYAVRLIKRFMFQDILKFDAIPTFSLLWIMA